MASKSRTAKLRALTDYASTWPGLLESRACVVTIGRESYPAVKYKQQLDTPSGSRSAMEGQRMYEREGIYCLGKLPHGYTASKYRMRGDSLSGNAICFPYDGRDWYVAGHMQKIERKFKQYHKLGVNFVLSPWDVPSGEAIDYYYQQDRGKSYKRVPMSVVFVD